VDAEAGLFRFQIKTIGGKPFDRETKYDSLIVAPFLLGMDGFKQFAAVGKKLGRRAQEYVDSAPGCVTTGSA